MELRFWHQAKYKQFIHAQYVSLAEVVCTEQYRCELEVDECDNAEFTMTMNRTLIN